MANASRAAKRKKEKKDKRKKRLAKFQDSQQLKSDITSTDRKLGKVQIYTIIVLMIAASAFIFYKLSR